MDKDKMIEILRDSSCNDPFDCPFCMYGKNSEGHWGCFAQYPNGNPYEKNQGCLAQQAADIIENLVDVVRCKDCKYAEVDMCCSHPIEWNNSKSRNHYNPNWFCADGERAE